ncbi:MAG: hypothetical protein ACYS0D_03975 [Planctomycetota bacterium]|jgi:hypothetical protein
MAGKQGNKKSTKKKRKRQQVTRHYKPSLGRWVETYKRTGDNAKKKRSRHGAGQSEETLETSRPSGRRKWIAAVALVAVTLAAATTALLIQRATSEPSYEIHRAREPVLVRIKTGSAEEIAFASEGTLRRWVSDAARDVSKTLDKHPDRLVTLTLGKVPLSHGELPAHERRALHVRLSRDPVTVYESTLVRVLGEILDTVERERGAVARISVRGLPVEPRIVDQATARRTNARFRPVMARLDPLVSDHALLMADTSLTEEQMVLAAMPEGLRWRGGRPILFKTNGAWRVLVDEGADLTEDPGLLALLANPNAIASPPPRGNVVLGSRPGQPSDSE